MGKIVAFEAERRQSNRWRSPADAVERQAEIVLLPCIRRERLAPAAEPVEQNGGAGRPAEKGRSAAAAIRLG